MRTYASAIPTPSATRSVTKFLNFSLLTFFSLWCGVPAQGAGGQQALHGHIPAAVAALKPMGRLAATNRLDLAFGLPLRNGDKLAQLLQQIYDPASPNFRHYLTPAQFTEQFGPTEEDYEAVAAYAAAHGLKVSGRHPNRILLDVNGTVADIERALHVKMQVYQHPTEHRMFFAPDVEPSLDLAVPVLHIGGLDTYALPRPAWVKLNASNDGSNGGEPTHLSGSGPGGSYMGYDFRAAYVSGVTLTGAGQTVGLLECDGYTTSDITYYENAANLPSVTLSNVLLDGFNGQPSGNGGEVEVSLDIEMAVSMAPGLSSVIVYETSSDTPAYIYDLLNRMATDNKAKQMSSSWVIRNNSTLDQIYGEFAAQGQTFFQASGDQDAYTAATFQWEDDPYVTLVGGTTLTTTGAQGSWVSETVWNAGEGEGSGGGISTNYSIPSWQTNINMSSNFGSTTMRNIPDVALIANNVDVRADGLSQPVGGTSCAAPLWAAFTALVNQQAAAFGEPTVGFLNPAIYAVGSGTGYTNCFHDIVTGNNFSPSSPTRFPAEPGYDLCTGWGTPAGLNLIKALLPGSNVTVTLPASATEGAGVLAGAGSLQLRFAAPSNVVMTLVSSDPAVLAPASVTVPASQTNATFNLTLVDDGILDGTRTATVTASAPGYGSASGSMIVYDIETATLQVSLPAVTKGQGAVQGTVQVSAVVGGNVTVSLSSANTNLIQVPATMVVSNGQSSAAFSATVGTDGQITGPETVNVTAHVQNWTDGVEAVVVSDNLDLTVLLPAAVSTGAGVMINAGSVALAGTLTTNLSVSLVSSLPGTLIVPAATTIVAGQLSGLFNLTMISNSLASNQTATVTASAPGFVTGSASTLVVPGSLQGLPTNPAPSNLAVNVPANTNLSWSIGTNGSGSSSNLIQNGGFETGTFANWTQVTSPELGAFVINNGTYKPHSPDPASPPYAGNYDAVGDEDGPGVFYMYQDVSIPAGVPSATLSWAHRVRNFYTAFSSVQEYQFRICDTNNNVLATAFTTSPGNTLLQNWVQESYNMTSFAGKRVRVMFWVDSTDYFLDVDLDSVSLQTSLLGVTNDVYFGVNPAPGPAQYQGSITSNSWTLPLLEPQTTYYWQIISHQGGTSAGPVWQFTTSGVDHFAWSAIPSPQYVSQPFAATITAQDAFNQTVSNFTGNVSLTATGGAQGTNGVIEDFASGVWPHAPWVSVTPSTAGTLTTNAHDGHYALMDPEWTYRTDTQVGQAGETLSMWVQVGSGRAYLGFGASASGTWAFICGENTSQLLIDQVSGYATYTTVAAVSQAWQANKWYNVSVQFLSTNSVVCNLYDSDGVTLLNSVSWNAVTGLPGGIAIRSFDGCTLDTIATGSETNTDFIAITPTNSGNFANGAWTGNIAVLQDATNVYLQANDGNGHMGQSGGFNVDSVAPVILTQPTNQTLPVGATAIFAVTATGLPPLTFQWSVNGTNLANGTNATLILTNVQIAESGSYSVVVSNTNNIAISSNAVLTVGYPPAIAVQPSSQEVPQGTNVLFTVTATGTAPLSYQWSFNGAALAQAANSSLSLTNVQGANIGSYSVLISSPFGSVLSSNAVLTVDLPPAIVTQPASQTVYQGLTATFSVTAGGSLPLTYQWQFNTTNISGATNASLTLTNVSFSEAGSYSVAITNAFGATNSANAVLTVNPLPPCAPVTSGLLDWWPANGNANDIVGGNNGTIPYSDVTYAAGEVGQAFAFSGGTQNQNYGNEVDFGTNVANFGTNDFTIDFWIKEPANTASLNAVLEKRPVCSAELSELSIRCGPLNALPASQPGQLDFELSGDNVVNTYYFAGNKAINDGFFHHAAFTRQGTTLSIYVDGLLDTNAITPGIATISNSAMFRAGQNICVGVDGTQPFVGELDELDLYNRALSPAEIYTIYAVGSEGKCGIPPSIVVQPQGQNVVAGGSATFSVTAGGVLPLNYQWQFNTTNINGATNASLTLANVSFSEAGSYSVTITNSFGATNSANAVLTVNPPPPCAPVTSGLLDWWPANGNANDIVGTNNGTIPDSVDVTYAAGEVGQAFAFSGISPGNNDTGNEVDFGANAGNFGTNDFTIDFWIKQPANATALYGVLEKRPECDANVSMWHIRCGTVYNWSPVPLPGQLDLELSDNANVNLDKVVANKQINDGLFHHAAFVRQGLTLAIYIDGVLDTNITTPGVASLANSSMFRAGQNICVGVDGTLPFVGELDELDLFDRALSPKEIYAIYAAGSTGKCGIPPNILVQPQGQTVVAGSSATFSVTAGGTPPLNYQWQFNTTNISGATNASLTLANVSLSEAGSYSVTITNLFGATNSANAVLTVNPPPPCAPVTSGLLDWWPGNGNANDIVGTNNGTIPYSDVTYAAGEVGQAFAFSGGTVNQNYGNEVDFGANAGNVGTNDFTIDFWIKEPANTASFNAVLEKRPVCSAELSELSIRCGPFSGFSPPSQPGQLDFELSGDNVVNTYYFAGNKAINDGFFHHAAFTRQGTTLSIYVDGLLDTNAITPGIATISNSATFRAGQNICVGVDGTQPFVGELDELDLFDRALSPAEIYAIYAAGSAGKCAMPPNIIVQPQGQIVAVGSSATFSVTAAGAPPLTYQWQFNTTNINGATNTSLTLTNVTFSEAGSYSVTITNSFGATNSANAVLTVNPPPPCAPVTSGLLDWWPANGNANDIVGTNNGTIPDSVDVTYAAGEVGRAFAFSGISPGNNDTGNEVDFGANVGNFGTNDFTIDFWIKQPANATALYGVLEKRPECDANVSMWHIRCGTVYNWSPVPLPGQLDLELSDNNNVNLDKVVANKQINDGLFHHAAFVRQGLTLAIYIDGVLDTNITTPGVASLANSSMFRAGQSICVGVDGTQPFVGELDELDLFDRALSPAEIYAIYAAGSAGKCAMPPNILVQPQGQIVAVGGSATFSVTAGGTPPLNYQWSDNGTNLAGATNSSLTLLNVHTNNQGIYAVTVSNLAGITTSSNAVLTVGLPPMIRVQPASQSVETNCSATFAVSAAGIGPFSYQWWNSGLALGGQTNSSLAISNVQATNFSSYCVVITNVFGVTTSAVAVLAPASPPVANPDTMLRFAEGGVRLNVSDLTSNDTVALYDALTVIAVSSNSAAGGSVTLSNPWVYYAPPAGGAGSDSFTYTVSDGHCGTAVGTVTMQVKTDNPQPSRFAIGQKGDGSLQLSFDGIPGETYQLEYSVSLTPPNWQVLTNQAADSYGVVQVTDWPVTNAPGRFYRAVWP